MRYAVPYVKPVDDLQLHAGTSLLKHHVRTGQDIHYLQNQSPVISSTLMNLSNHNQQTSPVSSNMSHVMNHRNNTNQFQSEHKSHETAYEKGSKFNSMTISTTLSHNTGGHDNQQQFQTPQVNNTSKNMRVNSDTAPLKSPDNDTRPGGLGATPTIPVQIEHSVCCEFAEMYIFLMW